MSILKELCVCESKDRVNEEIVYTIALAYAFLERVISRFLSKYKLTAAKFNILLMVKHKGKDEGIPQNEISKLLLVTTSNITRMVDKLEMDEYVLRISKKGDRRVNLIKITPKGSDLLDEIWPAYKSIIDKLVDSHFSESEKKTVKNLLLRLKN